MAARNVALRFATGRLTLSLPEHTDVLSGPEIPAIADPEQAVRAALQSPTASESLRSLARRKQPNQVVITMSDITRPVPNELLITAILAELNEAGVADDAVTILIATGMHRPSTPAERDTMLGRELQQRCRVVDHEADKAHTLTRVSNEPPVSINSIYVEADLKIVTGLIEPHFMAGYSGGRKGICPGIVDLETVQRFHGHRTMGNPAATEGKLTGNPCHEISVRVAQQIGCDFLVNAAITHDRSLAGVFAGDLIAAHEQGCKQVAAWTTAKIEQPYDLVVQSAGGYPLDESFYQTVKGMVTALPALHENSTLLMLSACNEVGSPEYTELMRQLGPDYRKFLRTIQATETTSKDQWQYQMQTRVLERIGAHNLILANDGLPRDIQQNLAVTPAPGPDSAQSRAQHFVDTYLTNHPTARIAAIPEGPYTMLTVSTVPE